KVAGGVRTAKDAVRYLVLVRETAGPDWLTPEYFRIGASSLLNDLLMQRRQPLTGAYSGPGYFTLDYRTRRTLDPRHRRPPLEQRTRRPSAVSPKPVISRVCAGQTGQIAHRSDRKS